MDVDALRQQIATMRQSLIDEQMLDCKFVQMEQLQDYTENPNFVEEKITLYFDDSPAVIAKIEEGLDQDPPLDHAKLTSHLQQFEGRCASVGANKVKIEINKAIQCCSEDDMEGCRAAVDKVKDEYNNLKSRLQSYFEVIHQARIAGTSNPPK